MRRLSPKSLAHFASRRPWTVLSVWLVFLLLAFVSVSQLLDTALETEPGSEVTTESETAQEILDSKFPVPEDRPADFVIVHSDTLATQDPAFHNKVNAVTNELNEIKEIDEAVNFYQAGDQSLVSGDQHTTLIPFTLVDKTEEADATPVVEAISDEGTDRFQVSAYGAAIVDADFGALSQHDLEEGELKIGLPAAILVLLLVFGAIVAASLPLLVAALSIIFAMGLAALIGQAYTLSIFVINMITAVGLAVGIDYSLFILSRYREERAKGLSKYDAIDKAGGTASRAVLFSGIAVILGLSGLAIVPASIMRSLGLGAIIVAGFAVIAALTVVPALLGLLGDRVNKLKIPYFGTRAASVGEAKFWGRVANVVLKHPVISLVVSVVLLLAAASPVLDLETGLNQVSSFPESSTSRQGFELFDEAFSGRITPAQIVISGSNLDIGTVQASATQLEGILAMDNQFLQPQPLRVAEDGNHVLLSVPIAGDPGSKAARDSIERLRSDYIPAAFNDTDAEVLVGGETAEQVDFINITDRYLIPVIAFVLTLSFILLTIAFRSIVLPIKAILINLLSVGAAYGMLVLVFQKGVGAGLLGFQQVDVIEAWIPIFLFALLFGLSMDYHVFLLSRIKEHYLQIRDNTNAVRFGITSTARLITGAALIIIAVFVGFASGDLVMFQQMGFGVGVALLLDATIIRSVIVPASMKLLGHWNWYLPSWLNWIPELHVEGATGRERSKR